MTNHAISDQRIPAGGDRGDRRRALRYSLELPVEVANARGRLHDFSACGLALETDQPFALGSRIAFSLTLGRLSSGTPLTLAGWGRVVRTERWNGKHRVAVEISSWEKASA